MTDKFANVTVEEDTNVLISLEAKLDPYDVLYQKWTWDGISAESFIFVSADVAELSDKELEREARASPLIKEGSELTIKRSESGFTFVNFNFETD